MIINVEDALERIADASKDIHAGVHNNAWRYEFDKSMSFFEVCLVPDEFTEQWAKFAPKVATPFTLTYKNIGAIGDIGVIRFEGIENFDILTCCYNTTYKYITLRHSPYEEQLSYSIPFWFKGRCHIFAHNEFCVDYRKQYDLESLI